SSAGRSRQPHGSAARRRIQHRVRQHRSGAELAQPHYLLGFQPVPGNFRVFGASDERYHIAGGNEQLPQAIAAALTPGTVQLNTAPTGIVHNADKSYTLSLKAGNVKTSKTFDRVIVAIPFSVLRGILTSDAAYRAADFTPLKQTAITLLGYGKNAKLQLQF